MEKEEPNYDKYTLNDFSKLFLDHFKNESSWGF